MLQYAAMDEELWEEGELEFLHTLSADYKSLDGISNFKQEDSSLGEIPVVKITCDQTPGEDSGTYHARYTLIPVNREAVLTVASAVPEDADITMKRILNLSVKALKYRSRGRYFIKSENHICM